MEHRNGIFAGIALALSATALAGLLGSDEYAHAAGAEAAGDQALLRVVASQYYDIPARQAGKAGASLVAASEVSR